MSIRGLEYASYGSKLQASKPFTQLGINYERQTLVGQIS